MKGKDKSGFPKSYVVFALVFAVLTLMFSVSFFNGSGTGEYIVGPWVNLMLMTGSFGLLATVAVASIEWLRMYKRNK